MSDKPRRDVMAPPVIVGVEHDPDHLLVNQRGEIRSAPMIYLDEHTTGRIRAGYCCAKCFEPHPEAYPERCSVCKFPMRELQAEFVAKHYQGSVRIGQGTTQEEEEAFLAEYDERRRREQNDPILRPTQILLPGRDF